MTRYDVVLRDEAGRETTMVVAAETETKAANAALRQARDLRGDWQVVYCHPRAWRL